MEAVQGWRVGKCMQTPSHESDDKKQKSDPEKLLSSGGNSKFQGLILVFYYMTKLLRINKII